MKKYSLILSLPLLFIITNLQLEADDERYLKINRSIEIFGKVYQEIVDSYVDEIDPELFIRAGIEGMLGVLDPYTAYIDDSGREMIDLLTTGRYGGVGITIGIRDNSVTVTSVMEGYSAAKQGIAVGDRLIAVDEEEISTMSLYEIRSTVRGEPGTLVSLTIVRGEEPDSLIFTIVRETIRVNNLKYAGYLDDGIVYLLIDRFSRGVSGEVREALNHLQENGKIKGVILDLRDNSGGLLDAAVDVADVFFPRGTLIVSTEGRGSQSFRNYRAARESVFSEIPLVVLVNERSASASEIVAGAVQDNDRGVIVGTQSFGKGLVQTISHLTQYAQLKITTSRYYTPSGRSIQSDEYLEKAPKGLFPINHDKQVEIFHTTGGRIVREGNGIEPDSVVRLPEQSRFVDELLRHSLFFLFVNNFMGPIDEGTIDYREAVKSRLVDKFEEYLDEKDFRYEGNIEVILDDLKNIAIAENYSGEFFDTLEMLHSYINDEKNLLLKRHKDELVREITLEAANRLAGERGKIEAGFEFDPQISVAIDILKDDHLYRNLLQHPR